jgi:hypothetical protein
LHHLLLSPVEGNMPESENTLVDGVIELSQLESGMQLVREIKVFKLRGANHLLGKHVFEINQSGVEIFPASKPPPPAPARCRGPRTAMSAWALRRGTSASAGAWSAVR